MTAPKRTKNISLKPRRVILKLVSSLFSTANDPQAFWTEIRKHRGRNMVTKNIVMYLFTELCKEFGRWSCVLGIGMG